MKTFYKNLTDFDTNSGTVEDPSVYRVIGPGLKHVSGTYIMQDAGDFSNFGLECQIRFSDITNGTFRVLLGTTAAGVGRAIDFNMTSSSQTISLVNISTITGVADSTIVSKEMLSRLIMATANWYNLKVIISNNILKLYFGNNFIFETNLYVAAGTYWGFSGLATSTDVHTSDTYEYLNQVFYGNVNINGVPSDSGVAIMFKQVDGDVVDYQECNVDGDYAILITADPAALNKYFIIGYVRDNPSVQPRGVGNLTL